MQPTKAQWKLVEDALRPAFSHATLRIDGYELSLWKEQVAESRFGIVPYVNGWHRGEWLLNDCEERRRFMRPCKRFIHSEKFRRRLKRMRKRALREMRIDPDEKFTYYSMYWPAFVPLRRHLQRENENIEIVTINRIPFNAAADDGGTHETQ